MLVIQLLHEKDLRAARSLKVGPSTHFLRPRTCVPLFSLRSVSRNANFGRIQRECWRQTQRLTTGTSFSGAFAITRSTFGVYVASLANHSTSLFVADLGLTQSYMRSNSSDISSTKLFQSHELSSLSPTRLLND